MNLEQYREGLPEFAKDIRLNLSTVLSDEGAPGLSGVERTAVALAAAYALADRALVTAIRTEFSSLATPELVEGAKTAAALMAMNNVYYRSIHIAEHAGLKSLPAKLRMNAMAKPPIEKKAFELASLGVSALNGCGMCITAHIREGEKHGVSVEGLQSVLRIAATLNAAASAQKIAELGA